MACNCNTNPCGCQDVRLTAPVTTCVNTEPCEEIIFTECVSYTGNDIYTLGINNGDRMDVVLKKLALYLTDPTCYDPTATCQAIKDFEIDNVVATEATIYWTVPASPAAITDVKIQYSTDPAFCTVNTQVVTGYSQWTIINLLQDTTYYVRMVTSTAVSVDCCTSITLSFKTLLS